MGYYIYSEMCDELLYTSEERERLTEDFQALACGPEVDNPVIEYADYEAADFLGAEYFNTGDFGDYLTVQGLTENINSTAFFDEICSVLSKHLGEDKGRRVWIMSGDDGEKWPIVFEHGQGARSPEMTTVYKVHISDTEMEVRGDDA